MIILAVFAAKILRRVETCEKIIKIANQSFFLPTAKYNRDLRAHKMKRITSVKRAMTVSCSIKQDLFFLSIKSHWDIEKLLCKFELGCSDKIRSFNGLLQFNKLHLKSYRKILLWDTTDYTSW